MRTQRPRNPARQTATFAIQFTVQVPRHTDPAKMVQAFLNYGFLVGFGLFGNEQVSVA